MIKMVSWPLKELLPFIVIFYQFFVIFSNLLQKFSLLKPLGQIYPNLATIIFGVSSLKNVSGDPANQPRWPPRLKIEHKGKMQFLAYNSKTKAFRANLTWGGIVKQVRIYLPWNFQMNRITLCWVAAPELVILRKFCCFWLLSWILLQIEINCKQQ